MAETIVYAILLPMAVAASVVYSVGRQSLPRYLKPAVLSLAITAAITASWMMLPQHPPWIPKQHWHWIPAIAWLMTALSPLMSLGAASRAIQRSTDTASALVDPSHTDRQPIHSEDPPTANLASFRPTVRASLIPAVVTVTVIFLAATVAAWMLVPLWKSLQPPRIIWLPCLAGYLFLLGTAASCALNNTGTTTLTFASMTIAAAVTAILIAMFVSVTYASFAAPAASALAGCWLAVWRKPDLREHARGAALGYAVLIGGWAFIGCIEPRLPVWWLLAIPWSGVGAAVFELRSFGAHAATPRSIWTRIAITFGLQIIIIGVVIYGLFSTIAHP
ncbi:MAG: hypothetical protein RIS70_1887 [Planctomycetota bacterium]